MLEGTKQLPGVGQFWTPMVGQFSKPIDNITMPNHLQLSEGTQ